MNTSPIESWLKTLEEHPLCTPHDTLKCADFKTSKNSLKHLAKRGELSEEQLQHALSIFSNRNDCKKSLVLKEIELKSTPLLFYSRQLWSLLFSNGKSPIESGVIESLSKEAFSALIDAKKVNFKAPELPQLAEAIIATRSLELMDIEQTLLQEFESQVNFLENHKELNVRDLYLIATAWPTNREQNFISLKQTACSSLCSFMPDSQQMKKELTLFKKILQEPDVWKVLSRDALFRFFLFLQCDSINSAKGFSLTILNGLLDHLKSEHIPSSYAQHILKACKNDPQLQGRLKEDRLVILLENIEGNEPTRITVSYWPLFAESVYFEKLKRYKTELKLREAKASAFPIIHTWIEHKTMDIESLSIEMLIDVLYSANYFQLKNFDEIKKQIINNILEICDDSEESLINLIGLAREIPCSEFEDHVISILRTKFKFLSIQKATGKSATYGVRIHSKNQQLSFASLDTAKKILKTLHHNNPIILMSSPRPTLISSLCAIYIATELNLKELNDFEKAFFNTDWGPLNILKVLSINSSEIYSFTLDLLRKKTQNSFWLKFRQCLPDRFNTFKEEAFESVIHNENMYNIAQMDSSTLIRFILLLEILQISSSKLIKECFIKATDCISKLYSTSLPEPLKNLQIKMPLGNYALYIPFSWVWANNLKKILNIKKPPCYSQEQLKWAIEILKSNKENFNDLVVTATCADYFHASAWVIGHIGLNHSELNNFIFKLNEFLCSSMPKSDSLQVHKAILSWAGDDKHKSLIDTYFKLCKDPHCILKDKKIIYSIYALEKHTLDALEALSQNISTLHLHDSIEKIDELLNAIENLNINEIVFHIKDQKKITEFPFHKLKRVDRKTLKLYSEPTDNFLIYLKNNPGFIEVNNLNSKVEIKYKNKNYYIVNYNTLF